MKELVIVFILALIAGSFYNEFNSQSSSAHQTRGSGQELITELDSGNFQGIVLDSKQPVLVDFYTTWCGPCKDMEPVMGTLAYTGQDKLKIARVDCDKQKMLAERYEVTGYPTFVLFENGQVKDRSTGGRSLDEMRAWLKLAQVEVPPPSETMSRQEADKPSSVAPEG